MLYLSIGTEDRRVEYVSMILLQRVLMAESVKSQDIKHNELRTTSGSLMTTFRVLYREQVPIYSVPKFPRQNQERD